MSEDDANWRDAQEVLLLKSHAMQLECDAQRYANEAMAMRAERDALKAKLVAVERDLLMQRDTIKSQLEWGKQMQSERDYWKSQAIASDGELVALEDALIGRDDLLDVKGKLVDRATVLKERIRDLIAAEGEAGDAKTKVAELDRAARDDAAYIVILKAKLARYEAAIRDARELIARIGWSSVSRPDVMAKADAWLKQEHALREEEPST